MNTSTIQTSLVILTADEGKLLTNGETAAKEVVIPSAGQAALWREIDESEWHEDDEGRTVVRYSKYKLKTRLATMGMWEQVKEAIQSAGFWDSFLLIQDIASDNPELLSALPVLKTSFPSVDVDALLAECETD